MRVKVQDHVLSRAFPTRERRSASRSVGWKQSQDEAYGPAEARGWDAPSQLASMDAEGLDMAVLFPSRGLFVLGLDTEEQAGSDGFAPPFAAAIARAYNDWLHDFCAADPRRLLAAGCWHRTTWAPRSRRSNASSATSGSPPCSCIPAA